MDPQQQQQFAGAMAGFMGVFFLIGIVFAAFFIFLLWRIFTKAGLAGPLSLIAIFPGIGPIIVLCILAFSDWKVVPAPTQYSGLQPYPPPPTNYPPPPPTYTPPQV
jgi:heme/copper-type cytochrome/quinol oxidase subunit 2